MSSKSITSTFLYTVFSDMQVMWVRLYRKGTSMEGGTLLQLKNLLNRSNVPRDVHKDVNATEDFVQVVLSAHIIAAAMEYFGMESLGDKPNPNLIPSDVNSLTKEEKKRVLFRSIDEIVKNYTNIALPRGGHGHQNPNLHQTLMVYKSMPRNFFL